MTSGIISNIQSFSNFQNLNIVIKIDEQFLDFHFKFYYNNLIPLVQKTEYPRNLQDITTYYTNICVLECLRHFFLILYLFSCLFISVPLFSDPYHDSFALNVNTILEIYPLSQH